MDSRFSGPPVPTDESPSHADPPTGDGGVDEEAPPARPSVWPALAAPFCALLLGAFLAVIALLSVGGGIDRSVGREHFFRGLMSRPGVLIRVLAMIPLAMAAVALTAAAMSRVPWRHRLGLVPGIVRPADYPTILLGNVGAFVVSAALLVVLSHLHWVPAFGKEHLSLVEMFHNVPPGLVPWVLIATSVLPGVGEELLFRGYVQRRLLERWRPAWAIGVTAIVFTAFHGDVAYAAFILPGALYFGYVAWRSQSILPTIVCHVLENGSVQLVQMLAVGPMGGMAEPSGLLVRPLDWILLGGAVVLAAGAVLLAVRRLESLARESGAQVVATPGAE